MLRAAVEPDIAPIHGRARSLIFADPLSCELLRLLERTAPSEAPVLIRGETGTGKELVARHIHQLSGRKGPFLAVNCGAISEHLAESELFGHEAGAFTGATGKREGWFEAANEGTLFLDEIGDLPLRLQVKLLRVLQEQEVVRIGSRRAIPVNVRLITATNVDLNAAVSAGHFRLDLYYRLNIVQVYLPRLAERRGDILPLANHFLSQYSRRLKLPLPFLGPAAIAALEQHAWPGNIRELENVIHFALLVASDREILPEHLKLQSDTLLSSVPAAGSGPLDQRAPLERIGSALRESFDAGVENVFQEIEKTVVSEAFRYSHSNQVRAAAILGISRNVMRTLLKRHKLIDYQQPADSDC
jgi:DNA-binding NtrC family response regulator